METHVAIAYTQPQILKNRRDTRTTDYPRVQQIQRAQYPGNSAQSQINLPYQPPLDFPLTLSRFDVSLARNTDIVVIVCVSFAVTAILIRVAGIVRLTGFVVRHED